MVTEGAQRVDWTDADEVWNDGLTKASCKKSVTMCSEDERDGLNETAAEGASGSLVSERNTSGTQHS